MHVYQGMLRALHACMHSCMRAHQGVLSVVHAAQEGRRECRYRMTAHAARIDCEASTIVERRALVAEGRVGWGREKVWVGRRQQCT